MSIRKISEDEIRENSVASLATRPNENSGYGRQGLSAEELKNAFDALGRLNASRYNELVDALQSGELGNLGGDGGDSVDTALLEEMLAEARAEAVAAMDTHEGELAAHRDMKRIPIEPLTAADAMALVRYENAEKPGASVGEESLAIDTGEGLLTVKYNGKSVEIPGGVTMNTTEGLYVPLCRVPVTKGKQYAFVFKERHACTTLTHDIVLLLSGARVSLYESYCDPTEHDVDTRFPILVTAAIDGTAYLYCHLRAGRTSTGLTLTPIVYELGKTGYCKLYDGGESKETGLFAHAIGHANTATGYSSFAAGEKNTASGICSVAVGRRTTASGDMSHAEGLGSRASGKYAHAENCYTMAEGKYSHAEGHSTRTYADEATNVIANYAHSEGYATLASGLYAHAEGNATTASGNGSHSQNYSTTASGNYSHAEGRMTSAKGYASHAMGSESVATGAYSVAGGLNSTADGTCSIAMGQACGAKGAYAFVNGEESHANAEGSVTIGVSCSSVGNYAVAMGSGSVATGSYSVARGQSCTTTGMCSLAHGTGLKASAPYQVVFGRYNVEDPYAHLQIGDGTNVTQKTVFSVRNENGELSIRLGNTEITETQLKALLKLV